MPFTDMHDYGDMLVAAGFTTPVVDMERLTLTYSTRGRACGATSGRSAATRVAERGRAACAAAASAGALDAALERTRDADGRYALTFELVFAHAWKGEPQTTRSGEAIVRLQRRTDARRDGSAPSGAAARVAAGRRYPYNPPGAKGRSGTREVPSCVRDRSISCPLGLAVDAPKRRVGNA